MKRNIARTSFAVLAVLIMATAGWATTLEKLNDGEIVAAADLVVVAKCIQMKSEWVGRNLMTRYTFEVDEVWSGSAGSHVDVVVPGGADANRKFPVAMVYPGAPLFLPNEKSLLMLDQVAGDYSVVGFNQGRFPLGSLGTRSLGASRSAKSQTQAATDALAGLRARFSALIADKGAR